MPDEPRSLVGLHRFAVATAGATLLLIAAGGLVTSTESGLSVPDWPTTYGRNMFTFPPSQWVGGIRFEHGHRLVASFVGLLTVVLAVWLARREPRRWVVRLGWIALATVIAQGILGGITVIYLLPIPVSVAHACLAQTFFCLTVAIAVVTSPGWRGGRALENAALRRAATAAVALIFLQLLVGAVMRHTRSGLAIPDFPLSLGRLVPPLSSFPVAIAFAHRVGAVFVAAAVLFVVREVFRSKRPGLRKGALLLGGLVGVQIALGALTVLSGKDVAITTAHVATGALLLGVTLAVGLFSMRAPGLRLVAEPGRGPRRAAEAAVAARGRRWE
ncbi:MAG: heme A synthase [Thermoanaerobaculia bacterium]